MGGETETSTRCHLETMQTVGINLNALYDFHINFTLHQPTSVTPGPNNNNKKINKGYREKDTQKMPSSGSVLTIISIKIEG